MTFNQKVIKLFLLPILIILFFGFGLFYNQNRKSLAQEEFLMECGDEIKIGEAIDKAFGIVDAIDKSLQTIYSAPGGQITAAKTLLNLPKQCTAGNCQTGCSTDTELVCVTNEVCGECSKPCPLDKVCTTEKDCVIVVDGDTFPGKKQCWEEQICDVIETCEVKPCSGTPCPEEDIADQVAIIQQKYDVIKGAWDAIKDKMGEVDDILGDPNPWDPNIRLGGLLGDAQAELEGCAVSAEAMVEGEVIGKMLLTCEEARYQGILPPEKENCYPTNFFCCE